MFLNFAAFTVQAQNVGGIWLSGTGIVGDGSGIHNTETQVLQIEDSVVNLIGGSGGAAAGKLVFGNFKFKKLLNANSVSLFSAATTGKVLPNLIFKFYDRKSNGNFVSNVTITLNVLVVKYKISSPDNALSQTREEISLLYDKIQFTDNAGNSVPAQVGSHF